MKVVVLSEQEQRYVGRVLHEVLQGDEAMAQADPEYRRLPKRTREVLESVWRRIAGAPSKLVVER